MAAGKYNFLCEQGATFSPSITWTLDDGTTPINLSGYSARMQVREEFDSTTYQISLTTENGRITLGGATGTIDLLITDEDTTLLTAGTYKYDIELVSPLGTVVRLLKGNFKVDPEITK